MLKRNSVVTYLIVFLLVLLINFVLPRFMPGGPIAYLEGGQDQTFVLTEEQKQSLTTYYNLDQPVYNQMFTYFTDLFTGNFGTSISHKAPVLMLILAHAKWTLLLVGISTILTLVLGIILGLLSSWLHHKYDDRIFFVSMLSAGAIPEFVLAMLGLLLFSMEWSLFPYGGSETPFLVTGPGFGGLMKKWMDIASHAYLPVSVLTLSSITTIFLLMRNSAVDIMKEPYMFVAEAKGLSVYKLLFRHALRNALLPVFTLITLRIGHLLVGAILVETVFAYPGIGNLLEKAILSRDYPLMHGLFFIFAITVLLTNGIADYVYPKLDPRIRMQNGEVL